MVGFIDVMGVGLVYPMFSSMLFQGDCQLIPHDASDFTRGACLGVLLATMPIAQFFSGPILGMLSDQMGRRKVLIPSLAVGVAGYMLAVAAVSMESFAFLLLSRVLVGVSAGSAAVVGASIADISSQEEKAKNFGLFNMALGLGFTVGPFIGGILAGTSLWIIEGYALPFAVAGLATLTNLILANVVFEDTYSPKTDGKLSLSLGVKNIAKAFALPRLRAVFLAAFLGCFGWSFYWEFTPVTWIAEYGFGTAMIGNLYAYGAIVYAVSCGVLIRPLVANFSNQRVLCLSLLGCSLSIGLLCVNTSEVWLWVYIPLQQFCIALFWPTAAAVVSNAVSEDTQGEILGVLQSLESLAFATSPLLAGSLLGISKWMPIIIGSITIFAASLVLGIFFKKAPVTANPH